GGGASRSNSGARGFRDPQFRLDDAGDARRHLVLKVEHVFDLALEAVGPEMRAGARIDELPGDAQAAAGLAHRAFEDIVDGELAPDLLHVDRLSLVGEARIARENEEPSDARQRGDDL